MGKMSYSFNKILLFWFCLNFVFTTSLLSRFTDVKHDHAFKFYDLNGDGKFDKTDIGAMVEKNYKSKRLSINGMDRDVITKQLFGVLEGMLNQTGRTNVGYIGTDQWLQIWDNFVTDPSKDVKWHRDLANFFFYVMDQNDSGDISKDEFINFVNDYGASYADASRSFAIMTKSVGSINREVFHGLWNQYVTSSDPSAPGNFITGKLDFNN